MSSFNPTPSSSSAAMASGSSQSQNPITKDNLHPKGFRAFPPELRVPIFTDTLIEAAKKTYINSGRTPNLLVALSGDKELYDEALAIFCEVGTIRIIGCGKSTQEPHTECQLSDEFKLLVRNLKIEFRTFCGDLDNSLQLENAKRLSPSIELLTTTNLITQFPNLQNLTLDFKKFDDPVASRFKNYSYMVMVLVQQSQHLKKISVTMSGNPQTERFLIPEDAWYTKQPYEGLIKFEKNDLAKIQQGLGINPKMTHVPTVTEDDTLVHEWVNNFITGHMFTFNNFVRNMAVFQPIAAATTGAVNTQNIATTAGLPAMPMHTLAAGIRANPVLFRRQVFGHTKMPDMTWFWEAEEGKTLEWIQTDITGDRGGFFPWDAKPEKGDAIVWKEELVVRHEGGIFFPDRSSDSEVSETSEEVEH